MLWDSSSHWLRPCVYVAPLAVVATFVVCWRQTVSHVLIIRETHETKKRSAAVEIIALPAVYGVMSLSGLVRIYELFSATAKEAATTAWEHRKQEALSRYETVFFVADLYEAWALYVFGWLVLKLIDEELKKQESSQDRETEVAARAAAKSHEAVTSITWLGTWLFVAVCVLQAGCAMWMWGTSDDKGDETGAQSKYELLIEQFRFAGMIASCVAIYNVHTVDMTFHELLGDFNPFLKFLSVKILVSIAFMQKGALRLIGTVGLLTLTELELELFYSTLLVFECLVLTLMHKFAWGAQETWYGDRDGETQPLAAQPQEPASA